MAAAAAAAAVAGGGGPGGGGPGGGGPGGGGPGGGGPGGPPNTHITPPPGSDDRQPGCIDNGFTAEIKVRSKARMRSVKVYVDGKLVKTHGPQAVLGLDQRRRA